MLSSAPWWIGRCCRCREAELLMCCIVGALVTNRHAFDVRQNGHGSPAGGNATPERPEAIGHRFPQQIERLLSKTHRFLLHPSPSDDIAIDDFRHHIYRTYLSQIGVCGLIVGYTIVGAFMFIALEEAAKHPMTQEVVTRRRSCVDYLWNSKQTGGLSTITPFPI